jgi:hypothetical protein
MKLVSNAVFVLLLTTASAHAEGNHGFGPALFGAMSEICSEGDSGKADEIETQLLRNMSCDTDVSRDKKSLAHHRNSKDPAVRSAYDKEFAEYMSGFKPLTQELKAEMCHEIITTRTPCK